eukprot:507667_1
MTKCAVCKNVRPTFVQQGRIILSTSFNPDDESEEQIMDVTAINRRQMCMTCIQNDVDLARETKVNCIAWNTDKWKSFAADRPLWLQERNLIFDNASGRWKCNGTKRPWMDIEPHNNDDNGSPRLKKAKVDFRNEVSSGGESDEDEASHFVRKRKILREYTTNSNAEHDYESDNSVQIIVEPRALQEIICDNNMPEPDTDDIPQASKAGPVTISDNEDNEMKQHQKHEENSNTGVVWTDDDLNSFYTNNQASSFIRLNAKDKLKRRAKHWTYDEAKTMLQYVDNSCVSTVKSLEKSVFKSAMFQTKMKDSGYQIRSAAAYNSCFAQLKSGKHSLLKKKCEGFKEVDGQKVPQIGPTVEAMNLKKQAMNTVKEIDKRRAAKFNISNTGVQLQTDSTGNGLQQALDKHTGYVESKYKGKDKYFALKLEEFQMKQDDMKAKQEDRKDRQKSRKQFTQAIKQMNMNTQNYTELGVFILKQGGNWKKKDSNWSPREILKIIKRNKTEYVDLYTMCKEAGKTDLEIFDLLVDEIKDTDSSE